jgi:glutathione S-transferase
LIPYISYNILSVLHVDHHMKVKRPMPRPKPAVDPRVERSRQVLLPAGREWLAGAFSVADILMADVLRLVDRFDGLAGHPACRDYVARATARPSFVKAHADQMAHFAAAD